MKIFDQFSEPAFPDYMTTVEKDTYRHASKRNLGGAALLMAGFIGGMGTAVLINSPELALVSLAPISVGGYLYNAGDKAVVDLDNLAYDRMPEVDQA